MQPTFPSLFARLNGRRPGRAGRISLARAFSAQGVTLRDPQHSRSGIREEDGAVVIAMRQSDIQASEYGFSCLLWSPLEERKAGGSAEPRMEERLLHCRLASSLGAADGLIATGTPEDVESGAVLAMHVVKRRAQYWAMWGFAARAGARPAIAMWQGEPAQLMAA